MTKTIARATMFLLHLVDLAWIVADLTARFMVWLLA